MSDRRKRDRRNKRRQIAIYNPCTCWLCTPGREKRRIILERQLRRVNAE